MDESVFLKFEFLALVVSSIVAPAAIFWFMMWRRALSRAAVLSLGVALVLLTVVDVILLEILEAKSKLSPSLVDDQVFASELSVALYILPAVFAGIGTNILSDQLSHHLEEIEKRFERRPSKDAPSLSEER